MSLVARPHALSIVALTFGLVATAPSLALAQDAEQHTEDSSLPALEISPAVETPPPASSDPAELGRQLRARQEIATIHRAFGIATWASMAVTAVLGWIQFADEYGFHGNPNDTACANGTAVLQEFCTGVPWPHAIAGFTTAALYFTTAGLSLAMPAPLEPSADLELHKTLRWVHLATMLATAVFGVVTANLDVDFGTRQALAIVHQGLGVATFGLLTAAAAVIVF